MGLLDALLGRTSGRSIRIANFKQCLSETPGTTLIEENSRGRLKVHIRSETEVSGALIRLLNSSRVTLVSFSTTDESVSLTVDIE